MFTRSLEFFAANSNLSHRFGLGKPLMTDWLYLSISYAYVTAVLVKTAEASDWRSNRCVYLKFKDHT